MDLATENRNLRDQLLRMMTELAKATRFSPHPGVYAVATRDRVRALAAQEPVSLFIRDPAVAKVDYVFVCTLQGDVDDLPEDLFLGNYYVRDEIPEVYPLIIRAEIEHFLHRETECSRGEIRQWFCQPFRGENWARKATDALLEELRLYLQTRDTYGVDWEEIARVVVRERINR